MAKISKKRVFFVDDESCVCDAVGLILKEAGCRVTCFTNAEDCLKELSKKISCDLLITDINMPGIDGMELLKRTRRLRPLLPVLLITAYGNIPLAIKAVKTGAVDFLEKPLDEDKLLNAITTILEKYSLKDSYFDPMVGNSLTDVEQEILQLVVNGKSSKEIACSFYRSVRTVDNHRSHIMKKLGVDNIADLVKKAITLGLVKSE